jgi:hypothetical protein
MRVRLRQIHLQKNPQKESQKKKLASCQVSLDNTPEKKSLKKRR